MVDSGPRQGATVGVPSRGQPPLLRNTQVALSALQAKDRADALKLSPMSDFDFLTDRNDLRRARWSAATPVCTPAQGVTVELERFALTANNLTYAKLGDALGYWRYFPAPPGWGRAPVWGVARVTQSATPILVEGERVFGFFPVSTRCALTPAPRGAFGFADAAPHRAGLPAAYNDYRLIDRDPQFDRDDADAFLALRPLFILGFFLARWLEERAFFGAEQVIVSSASSKAAAALANELGARVEKVGLTSARNLAAVAKAKLFDRAIGYAAVADDEDLAKRPGVYVDIAGNPMIADRLKQRMGERLVRTITVGTTQVDAANVRFPADSVDDRDPAFFFAPAHIPRLRALWGADALRERLQQAWARYVARVRQTMTFRVLSGRAAIAGAYADVVHGEAPADVVAILTAPRLE